MGSNPLASATRRPTPPSPWSSTRRSRRLRCPVHTPMAYCSPPGGCKAGGPGHGGMVEDMSHEAYEALLDEQGSFNA